MARRSVDLLDAKPVSCPFKSCREMYRLDDIPFIDMDGVGYFGVRSEVYHDDQNDELPALTEHRNEVIFDDRG